MEMSSKSEEALIRGYSFVVVGGGIAGVSCVEAVSYLAFCELSCCKLKALLRITKNSFIQGNYKCKIVSISGSLV